MKRTAAACVVILACSVAAGQTPPVGPDFQVAYAGFVVYGTAVAMHEDGRFLTAWCVYFSVDCSVAAFERDGTPAGYHYLDGFGLWSQRPFVLTALGNGYLLAREGEDLVSAERRIVAQVLGETGTPAAAPFVVTSSADVNPESPRVGVGSSYLVVVWSDTSSEGTDTSGRSIQARYFDGDGYPFGDRFQVNTSTLGDQVLPDVVVTPEDELVVVWQSASSADSDSSGKSIQAQQFLAGGPPYGPDSQVNSHTPLDQSQPRIALNLDGSFVVTWTSASSSGDDSDSTSIQARHFLDYLTPTGPDFQVNTYTTGSQERPAVGIRDDGRFVVAWESYGSPGDDQSATSIQRSELEADLTPLGEQSQVNTTTDLTQYDEDVAMNGQGDFVVVWGNSNYQVRGRLFQDLIFNDGFESGDTSGWSETAP